jgi:hypothetical protein
MDDIFDWFYGLFQSKSEPKQESMYERLAREQRERITKEDRAKAQNSQAYKARETLRAYADSANKIKKVDTEADSDTLPENGKYIKVNNPRAGALHTANINTNLLDSAYVSSRRTGVPLSLSLATLNRESTMGANTDGVKNSNTKGVEKPIRRILQDHAAYGVDLASYNKAVGRGNEIVAKINNNSATDEELREFEDIAGNLSNQASKVGRVGGSVFDHAFKYAQSGNYNKSPKYRADLLRSWQEVQNAPEIVDYMKKNYGVDLKSEQFRYK